MPTCIGGVGPSFSRPMLRPLMGRTLASGQAPQAHTSHLPQATEKGATPNQRDVTRAEPGKKGRGRYTAACHLGCTHPASHTRAGLPHESAPLRYGLPFRRATLLSLRCCEAPRSRQHTDSPLQDLARLELRSPDLPCLAPKCRPRPGELLLQLEEVRHKDPRCAPAETTFDASLPPPECAWELRLDRSAPGPLLPWSPQPVPLLPQQFAAELHAHWHPLQEQLERRAECSSWPRASKTSTVTQIVKEEVSILLDRRHFRPSGIRNEPEEERTLPREARERPRSQPEPRDWYLAVRCCHRFWDHSRLKLERRLQSDLKRCFQRELELQAKLHKCLELL